MLLHCITEGLTDTRTFKPNSQFAAIFGTGIVLSIYTFFCENRQLAFWEKLCSFPREEMVKLTFTRYQRICAWKLKYLSSVALRIIIIYLLNNASEGMDCLFLNSLFPSSCKLVNLHCFQWNLLGGEMQVETEVCARSENAPAEIKTSK